MNKEIMIKEFTIIFRAILYFLIAALPAFADNLKSFADNNTSPSLWKFVWILVVSIIPGLVSLRAFYDGAAQRHQDKKEANGNHQTETITKQ